MNSKKILLVFAVLFVLAASFVSAVPVFQPGSQGSYSSGFGLMTGNAIAGVDTFKGSPTLQYSIISASDNYVLDKERIASAITINVNPLQDPLYVDGKKVFVTAIRQEGVYTCVDTKCVLLKKGQSPLINGLVVFLKEWPEGTSSVALSIYKVNSNGQPVKVEAPKQVAQAEQSAVPVSQPTIVQQAPITGNAVANVVPQTVQPEQSANKGFFQRIIGGFKGQ